MADHFHACTRCGQTVITRAEVPMCATCKTITARQDAAPQGEAMRLFAPAPTQIEGQMYMA